MNDNPVYNEIMFDVITKMLRSETTRPAFSLGATEFLTLNVHVSKLSVDGANQWADAVRYLTTTSEMGWDDAQ